ncbi:MAG: iron-containing alcohol dehydrogenase [Geminicoccaceae bacterium]
MRPGFAAQLDAICKTWPADRPVPPVIHWSDSVPDAVAALAGARSWQRLAVIDDANTAVVLGNRVACRHDAAHITLPAGVKASMTTVAPLMAALPPVDALVAVGSGTINDLVKLSAFRRSCPYAVVATAPSMNGFVSANASIEVNGLKSTLPARAPVAVLCDPGILAAAPVRLRRAGLGDALCRSTVQVDQRIGQEALGTAYDPVLFAWLAAHETALIERAAAIGDGDVEAVGLLMESLLLSGLSMLHAGSSAPASQGEHLVSHYMDMRGASSDALHGEQIAVTTCALARLQARLVAYTHLPDAVGSEAGDLETAFGSEIAASCHACLVAKQAAGIYPRLAASWPSLRTELAGVMRPAGAIEGALRAAGCPTRAKDLGWPADLYADALRDARALRDRYGALDLAATTGESAPWINAELSNA